MDDRDFEALGFKCGLEIHQQLVSHRKLFCRCPPVYRNDPPHYTIIRHMRPTLSEMGTYDGTALMEFKTKKNITYEFYRDTTCSYEIDDTPPFEMDDRALEISLVIAKAMDCLLVDEVHVSRKQYLDGTIPTGFQRTAIISLQGKVPWKKEKDIHIRQISLEEDACREVSDIGHEVTYRTDRLSIPLVEVVTEPDAKNPTEAGEMARLLGNVMRSTQLVRRGPGATRQDVNVSVEGGQRVEIKGVPKLSMIPTLTAGEAIRQHNLLKIKDDLHARGQKDEDMDIEGFTTMKSLDVTRLFEGRPVPLLSNWFGEKVEVSPELNVMAVLIPGFKNIMTHTTHYDQRFIEELSGRVRVIACLDRLPNVYSSDEGPKGGITRKDVRAIMKELGGGKEDVFVLVWGPAEDTVTGCQEIYIRSKEAFQGVPNETRQHITEHTTSFERILPGPDRMYPDTDSPPIVVSEEMFRRVDELAPDPWWEDRSTMLASGVPAQIVEKLVVSRQMPVYKKAVSRGSDPVFTARVLVEHFRHLRRKGYDVDSLPCDSLVFLLDLVKRGSVLKEAVPMLLKRMAKKKIGPVRAIEDLRLKPLSGKETKELVSKLVSSNRDLAMLYGEGRKGPLRGAVMSSIHGRYPGAQVMGMIEDAV